MELWKRIAIAVMVVLVDFVALAVPLAAFAAAYVVLARPAWFLRWVVVLYEAGTGGLEPRNEG